MPTTAIDLLKNMHGRSHGIMTGSGTSALVLSLWALGLHGKRVAIPNGVCYSVPLAVILSGNEPVYLDIDRGTLSLGVAQLRKYRCWYDAVIAVHNYGARCDIEGIAEFCAKENLPLIEDCCVALGAQDIGRWGDVSVFSFGVGKIVHAGQEGALLADSRQLIGEAHAMQKCFQRGSSSVRVAVEHLSAVHTCLYNNHYAWDRRRLAVFGALAKTVGERVLGYWDGMDSGFLYDELKKLPSNVHKRYSKASRLWDWLGAVSEVFRQYPDGVYWRFNIFIEEGRDDLMRHLHAKGYHASSWHAPASLFFWGNMWKWDTPVTYWVADHILNLWVDHTVGDGYIEGVSREVREWIKGRRNSAVS